MCRKVPAPISLNCVTPFAIVLLGWRAFAIATGMYSASDPLGQRIISAPWGSLRYCDNRFLCDSKIEVRDESSSSPFKPFKRPSYISLAASYPRRVGGFPVQLLLRNIQCLGWARDMWHEHDNADIALTRERYRTGWLVAAWYDTCLHRSRELNFYHPLQLSTKIQTQNTQTWSLWPWPLRSIGPKQSRRNQYLLQKLKYHHLCCRM